MRGDEATDTYGKIASAGQIEPIAAIVARTQFRALCDGEETTIAMTGGTPYSLKHPKNVGKCAITLACYDQNNAEIPNTKVILKRGCSILIYTSTNSTFQIKMKCDDLDKDPAPNCVLEIDE